MRSSGPSQATPNALINIRPVVAAMKEFFGGSQLSQFMDQTNPLAEIAHKRRLSALGPGGLSRERAGFDVRDVHHSHYGRICPIETPEGPNIGLIGNLATYARDQPLRLHRDAVSQGVPLAAGQLTPRLLGRIARARTSPTPNGKCIAPRGTDRSTRRWPRSSRRSATRMIPIMPFVSTEIEYLTADEEERYIIAQANVPLDRDGPLHRPRACWPAIGGDFRAGADPPGGLHGRRRRGRLSAWRPLMIPFLEHDDANRALMGANMQRQAVPLLRPRRRSWARASSGRPPSIPARWSWPRPDGEVVSVTARQIIVRGRRRRRARAQAAQVRPLQPGHLHQPAADRRQRATASYKGEPRRQLLDRERRAGAGPEHPGRVHDLGGRQLRGRHSLSDRIVRRTTSPPSTSRSTRSMRATPSSDRRRSPATSRTSARRACANLDERGIIYVGAEVGPGDILVGKITPKGETELTAEEKLLRAIFGEKAREVKDTSLRVPHGERGKVVEVRVFSRENNDELPPGVNQLVRVCDRAEAQDRRGRQDGRPPRQQGRDLAHAAERGHAVPARTARRWTSS